MYTPDMKNCMQCNQKLKVVGRIYCSNKCQSNYRYILFIEKWKRGEKDGGKGTNAKNISGHVRRFLREKYGVRCSLCGWKEKNPITNDVPLEVDHIDGNADNNQEANLRLICPNCHSLTISFRNLNKGRGRAWRRLKYLKED